MPSVSRIMNSPASIFTEAVSTKI
ncbi:hypothetical protein R2601_04423 [Salipiger bermudensis HTCC2601]|uniref:Uncharacterized protein n=1 Tax=Salipiger bermudensis (strain DSM 26914 / JCM 13377 / KCTC 12554 / HTCC2601) TaxID=314265 RepID=Q0FVW1_SALBH|nr:hypothetical protein R2601_04423 [Salipiger bermudensis HTCC2601]